MIARFGGTGFQFAVATEADFAVAVVEAAASAAAVVGDIAVRMSNRRSAAEAFAVHPTGS